MSAGSASAVPPLEPAAADSGPSGTDRLRRLGVAAAFLAPAAFYLGLWIVYPTVQTVRRSFYDRAGPDFVGLDNYKRLFTTDILLTSIKNNALWVLVVPAAVTAIGLVFAVLVERVRFSVAFRTAIFMPMAISAFAAGVTWRIMYVKDPDLGAVNAATKSVHDVFVTPGALTAASPSTETIQGSERTGFVSKQAVKPGQTVSLGLTAIPVADLPSDAQQAAKPESLQGGINGVVWRDFKPGGGGKPGVVDKGEIGLSGVTGELLQPDGRVSDTVRTEPDGAFQFSDVGSGTYRVGIAPQTFATPFEGVSWLGPRLITPAIMIAYVWIWAGFAMVVIAAGLAAIPRDVLEAARTDGASEAQVFRRVTVPLLFPVLTVVFITMLINVLKVFDIIIAIAPGSVQDDASVLALAMWRTSFGGSNDFGVGSAIAVFIFVLVIPILLLNVRRFRSEH